MKLYHGSNVKVKLPSLQYSERKHDFGKAFYLTSSYNQAMKWAKYKVRKNNYTGYPIVSIFNLSLSDINSLKIIRFEESNLEWLECTIENRMYSKNSRRNNCDLMVGPVVDGNFS